MNVSNASPCLVQLSGAGSARRTDRLTCARRLIAFDRTHHRSADLSQLVGGEMDTGYLTAAWTLVSDQFAAALTTGHALTRPECNVM